MRLSSILFTCLLSVKLVFTCPDSCKCNEHKRRVVCDGNLSLIPSNLPSSARELDLRGNRISVIPNDSLSLAHLVNFFANGNRITKIEPGAFHGLRRLKQLNLKSNKLTELKAGIFRGISKFTKIVYLHENEISSIECGVFRDFASVNLNVLSLRKNNLKEIKKDDLLGLRKLKNLFLENNELELISPMAFESLKNIRKLALDNNKLANFPAATSMFLLSSLSLAHNLLERLPADVFAGMRRLQVLNVSSNKLESIDLSPLSRLTSLDLRNNRLRNLPDLSKLVDLEQVHLEGNPWHCDCDIQDMRRWIESTDYDVTCAGPPNHSGKPLKSLSIENLKCSTTDASVPTISSPVSISTGFRHTSPFDKYDLTTSDTLGFSCDFRCVCSAQLRHVNCNRQGYSKVPHRFPRNTVLLDLRRNEIRTLYSNSFIYMPDLISIHLQYNKMTRVESRVFKGLKKLIYLYLNFNDIIDIDKNAFQDLESLSYLFLDNNRLNYLPGQLFRPLVSIFALYIRHNDLTELNNRSFFGLNRLRWLYLTNNSLSELSPEPFINCTSLQRLVLSYNEITSVPRNFIAGLRRCHDLDLSHNHIEELLSIGTSAVLTNLNLANNNLSMVDGHLFGGLSSLRTINLTGNALQHLPLLPRTLRKVDFGRNPWNCNCQMKSLQKYIKTSPFLLSSNIDCQFPKNLKGRPLIDLDPLDFKC
ncbi:unnamed protein product [Clavelina lepadiformis]|uniref:Uncharacterized protein n=1 Tax=Clavelina lepadiformis TaxID=159417 RepID=A0ABP0F4U4_CLALP